LRWPFTADFITAFIAAQTCTALVLTALLLFWRFNRWARLLLAAGVWFAALALMAAPMLESFGAKAGPHLLRNVLAWSVGLTIVGALLERRPLVALAGLIGEVPLWWLVGYLKESDGELCALHLTWIGLLIGILCRRPSVKTFGASGAAPEGSYLLHDTLVFVSATVLAALVCVFILDKRDGSADEWAYTFQASIFAKGRAYATSGRCQNYLQNFWVFESSGRLFSQYTPGWPLFMTPFVWIRAVWLSGPFSMGLMSLGLTRLARSAMRSFGPRDAAPSPRAIRLAGTWAAVLSTLATTILLNGASRFPHCFTVALYAWSLESLLQMSTPGLARPAQWRWGAALGVAAVMGVATRPVDGAFVAFGFGVLFLYALVRGRIGWRAVASAAVASGVFGGLVLVILRLQLGKWFSTGYSLIPLIHPWVTVKFSTPKPEEWRYGLPLATGAYGWWPCSLPLGMAGLAMLRGRARGLWTAFGLAIPPYAVLLAFLEYSRQQQFEYGNRYQAIMLVPMAVGGGVALAELTMGALEHLTAGRTALARGGPLALAVFAVVCGWMRIVALVWPSAYVHVTRHASIQTAIEKAHLRSAIVILADQTSGFDVRDMTTNYPLDLYPDPEVIIAIDRGEPEEAASCLSMTFPRRRVFFASGYDVALKPAW
jgi:hypothetical protein